MLEPKDTSVAGPGRLHWTVVDQATWISQSGGISLVLTEKRTLIGHFKINRAIATRSDQLPNSFLNEISSLIDMN